MSVTKNFESRLEDLEYVLNGNGKPGLKTDVAVLQREVAELPDIHTRLGRVEKVIWAAAGVLGALEIVLRVIGR